MSSKLERFDAIPTARCCCRKTCPKITDTDRLEAELADLQSELNGAVNRATAEALKQKAARIGQIKELTEDPETGSLTIVLEV